MLGQSLVAHFINKTIMECASDRSIFLPKKERWQGLPAQYAFAVTAASADHGAKSLETEVVIKWDKNRHPVERMAK